MGKKKSGLGKTLIRDRFTQNVNKRFVGGDSMLHTAEIHDGYDWGRLNLQSVTEESSFQEFLSTAELAGTDFKSEKLNISFVTQSTGLVNNTERAEKEEEHKSLKSLLKIPRRPKWDASTTPEQLKEQENASFLTWRHDLATLQEEKGLMLTPYEKNLEFWRQLWRVVEKSDVLVQILDARNPLMFRCEDLESYVKELDPTKLNVLLLNKADYLTEEQRQTWSDYFSNMNVTIAFFSAILEDEEEEDDEKEEEETAASEPTEEPSSPPKVKEDTQCKNSSKAASEPTKKPSSPPKVKEDTQWKNSSKLLSRQELIDYFKSFKTPEKEITCIGLVGYPNVGKSSTINSLIQQKKVSVSTTPGKTKHFQTLFLEPTLLLCDCPGLVMPSFVCTKADMVTNGVLPVDQLRDFAPPINMITSMIPRHVIEEMYGILIPSPREGEDPERDPTAEEVLSAYGYNRGFMTQRGLPDLSRCARLVLKDFVNGKLLFCHAPPEVDQKEFHVFPEKSSKPRADEKHQDANKTYKPVKVSAVTLDKAFFHKVTVGAHLKSSVPAYGSVRSEVNPAESGPSSSSSVNGEGSQKPGKKHFKKNKKEKLRRVFGYLDQV